LRLQRLLIFTSLVTTSILLVGLVYNIPQFIQGDIWIWINDSSIAVECFSDLSRCPEISKFPIAYLFNSFILNLFSSLGFLSSQQGILFLNLSLIFFFVLFISALKSTNISHSYPIPLAFLIAFAMTPLVPFYMYSGFLEIQAGILLSAAFLLVPSFFRSHKKENSYSKHFYSILIFCFSLYKDTYPLLLIFAAISTSIVFNKCDNRSSQARLLAPNQQSFLIATIIPCLLSLILSMLYNLIRYGSLVNLAYFKESIAVSTSIYFKVESLVAILFSPQGGLLVFWGLATIFCLKINPKRRLSFSVCFALFFLILCCIVSAMWWVPFGWDSWGNRLIIPSMIPFLALLIIPFNYHEPFLAIPAYRSSYRLSNLVLVLPGFISLYYIISSYSPWGRIELMRNHLYSPAKCQIFIAKLRDPVTSQYPTPEYQSCSSTRYWSWPELRLPSDLINVRSKE